jgi:hypothetical protein
VATGKPKTDEETVRSLLLWARDERIMIGELAVGTIRLTCSDLMLATREVRTGNRKSEKDYADSLYRQYGAKVIDKIEKELDVTYEDDDEEDEAPSEPATGRGRSARAPRRG